MPGASSLACPPAGLHRACLRPALLSLDGASPSLSRFRSALRHPPRWCILRSRAGTGQLGGLPPAQRMQFVIVSFGHAFLSEGRGLCVSLGWHSLPSRHAGRGYAGQGCEKSRRGRAGSREGAIMAAPLTRKPYSALPSLPCLWRQPSVEPKRKTKASDRGCRPEKASIPPPRMMKAWTSALWLTSGLSGKPTLPW